MTYSSRTTSAENTQITPLQIGIHIKQVLGVELRYSVYIYIHLNVFTSTLTYFVFFPARLTFVQIFWGKCTCRLIGAQQLLDYINDKAYF